MNEKPKYPGKLVIISKNDDDLPILFFRHYGGIIRNPQEEAIYFNRTYIQFLRERVETLRPGSFLGVVLEGVDPVTLLSQTNTVTTIARQSSHKIINQGRSII